MVLLRLITDDGPGRARRGGAAVAARRRRPAGGRRRARKGTRRCDAPTSRLRGEEPLLAPSTPTSTRSPAGASRRRPRRRSRWRSSTSRARRPAGRCGAARRRGGAARSLQRDPGRRRARRGGRRRRALGRARLHTFKLKLGAGDDVAPGARGARGARARRADPGRRERRLDVDEAARRAADDRAARHRARRAAGRRRSRRWPSSPAPTSILIAADESVERAEDAERARRARRLRPGDGQALQGRRHRRRRTRSPRSCPTYLSSALDGPVGIAAAAQVAQALPCDGPGRRARPRPRHPAAVRRDDRRARVRAARRAALSLPDGPGLGVEIDEDGARAAHRI